MLAAFITPCPPLALLHLTERGSTAYPWGSLSSPRILSKPSITAHQECEMEGSDARILDALDKDEATNPADLVAACTEAVANFANSGLRTLVWAYKEISAEEYKSYCDAKHQGRSSTTSVLSTAPSNSSLRSTGSAVEATH